MFSVLNTRLNQLRRSVGCERDENSYNRKESRCPNGQTGLNQLAGSLDCDQIEEVLMAKLVKTPVIRSTYSPLKLAKLDFLDFNGSDNPTN